MRERVGAAELAAVVAPRAEELPQPAKRAVVVRRVVVFVGDALAHHAAGDVGQVEHLERHRPEPVEEVLIGRKFEQSREHEEHRAATREERTGLARVFAATPGAGGRVTAVKLGGASIAAALIRPCGVPHSL